MEEAERQLHTLEPIELPPLPAVHNELMELRRNMKYQEELYAKAKSELDASRLLPSIQRTDVIENF